MKAFPAEEFSTLGPWITGFEINGSRFGGEYLAATDSRALRFVSEIKQRPEPRRILECGCLEGGHTAVLASALPRAQIIAIDVRESSLQKAAWMMRWFDLSNVQLKQEDLSGDAPALQEKYDAIFCIGFLYHLPDPENFLARAARAALFLWLWTVICAETEASVDLREYRGRMLPEFAEHPLAGIRGDSFLPTLGSLNDMLWQAGYAKITLYEKAMTSNENGPAILLSAERFD